MNKYIDIFNASFSGYSNYLWNELSHFHWGNYFYWLIAISLLFWGIEIVFPWRKNQKLLRTDFFLDAFYMFFNFFFFSLIGYYALSNVLVELFTDTLSIIGIRNLVAIHLEELGFWWQILIMFLARDFIHYNIHRLLHRVEWLWEFHKVHHSVKEMGFAAHLRFHWMETVVYRSLEYLPLAMIGFGIDDFLFVHLFTLAWGHFNHSNFKFKLGIFKYIFNNPQMHIWHHAKNIPNQNGVNFGLTLSVWDYLFKTDYIPRSGKEEPLGFEQIEKFPKTFWEQALWPFRKSTASEQAHEVE